MAMEKYNYTYKSCGRREFHKVRSHYVDKKGNLVERDTVDLGELVTEKLAPNGLIKEAAGEWCDHHHRGEGHRGDRG